VEATEPNIVQKAYQDLEARQAEADALNRGQAPVTGTFRTMQDYRGAERPGEAPVTGVGLAKPEPVGLTGRSLVRAELWRRKDTGEEEDAAPEWETFELPADPAERIAFLEEQVECSPDVWQPLVQECLQEQGLGQNQGNSTPR
jgi:hypothetical protein